MTLPRVRIPPVPPFHSDPSIGLRYPFQPARHSRTGRDENPCEALGSNAGASIAMQNIPSAQRKPAWPQAIPPVPPFFASVPETTNGKPLKGESEAKNALRSFSEVGSRGLIPRLSQPPREMHYAYILRSVADPDRFFQIASITVVPRI